jgi:hypothetical protein
MTDPLPERLLELAERCERATGPNFRLEQEIGAVVFPKLADIYLPYTASLDAAMTLVPDGANVALQTDGGPGPIAIVTPGERFARAATPALALCAAALRARAQSQRGDRRV